MKKTPVVATLLASLLALAAGMSTAQAQGTNVAIIDLSYIFKNHDGFNALMAEMKSNVETTEAKLKAEQETLNTMAKNFKDNPEFKPGTKEYQELEAEITQKSARLQADIALKKKEFMQREAQIYYTVYQEVLAEVKYYCDQNKIGLVLRFNGDPPDPNNPQDVLKDLNKMVVYYAEHIDITPDILTSLNARRKPAATPPGTRPPQTGVRPKPVARPQQN